MKRAISLLLLPLALCAAPPIVTGAIRDQNGDPIEGARISAGAASAMTDANGAFTLDTAARAVHIDCSYCVAQDAAVDPNGTVAAVVVRFLEVARDVPSAGEVQSAPYGFAQGALALTPFVVLRESRYVSLGQHVILNGVGPAAPVAVDGSAGYGRSSVQREARGVPGYDDAYVAIASLESAVRSPDAAGDGRFVVGTLSSGATILAGDAPSAAFAGGQPLRFNVAASAGGEGTVRRIAANFVRTGRGVLRLDAQTNSEEHAGEYDAFSASERSLYASFTAQNFYVSASARGAADAVPNYGTAFAEKQGTTSFAFGLQHAAQGGFFADASFVNSSVAYGAGGFTMDRLLHADTGYAFASQRFEALAAVAWYDDAYTFSSRTIVARRVAPAAEFTWHPNDRFVVHATAARAIRSPYASELSGSIPPTTRVLDAGDRTDLRISLSNLRRVRAQAIVSRYFDAALGTSASFGAALAWEIAPYVALRTWAMHVTSNAAYVTPFTRGVATPAPPFDPSSLWLSYEPASGAAFHLIFRRNAFDTSAYSHVDGSLSIPIRSRLRIFAQCEKLARSRYCDAGLRTQP